MHHSTVLRNRDKGSTRSKSQRYMDAHALHVPPNLTPGSEPRCQLTGVWLGRRASLVRRQRKIFLPWRESNPN
jgi:hypothetical protein